MTERIAFVNGTILDGTMEMQPQENRAVLVNGDTIVDIVEQDKVPIGYRKIDLGGGYLLPGLINLHVHLAGSGKPKKKATDPVKAVKLVMMNGLTKKIGMTIVTSAAKTQLLSGVTTVRAVGGISDFDAIVRDEIMSGKRVGPRILAATMAISVPGGHMAGSLAYEAHSAEEAAHYVDVIAKGKPDLIKLMITGGVMDAEVVGEPGVLRMQPEFVKAACDRAHALGYKVAAHVESPEGVIVALENGVDSIEHGAKPNDEVIRIMKEKGAFQVSTISPALPYALFDRSVSHATYEQQVNGKVVFDGIIDMAKACLANGIPVGLGTDTAVPYITQYDMWRELYYFAKYCDVTPKFALYSATCLNAKLAGIGDLTGTIEKGKKAEMIVVNGNPLEDLTVLRNVRMVMMNGRIYQDPKVKKIAKVETELDKYL